MPAIGTFTNVTFADHQTFNGRHTCISNRQNENLHVFYTNSFALE